MYAPTDSGARVSVALDRKDLEFPETAQDDRCGIGERSASTQFPDVHLAA